MIILTFLIGAKKMAKPITKALFLLLSTVLLTNLPAATPSLPAAPSKYVTDYAGVLQAGTADRLSSQLADFEHRTANELIIVIYTNIPKGVSIGDYARQLYEVWKIGKRGKDTGALLLIATQEHQGRIQAGRGLAAKLSEDTCRKIFTDRIAPRLDANDYDGACKAAASALIEAASR
jgi:uncharacterized protein